MAAPHLGDAALLLWSGFPELRGNVDATEQILKDTAVRLSNTDGCGGDTLSTVPSNTYGAGRIDVAAAFRAAESSSPPTVSVTDVTVTEGNTERRSDSSSPSMLPSPARSRRLGSGVIRVACVPTDGAGNVGRRSVATFRIV